MAREFRYEQEEANYRLSLKRELASRGISREITRNLSTELLEGLYG